MKPDATPTPAIESTPTPGAGPRAARWADWIAAVAVAAILAAIYDATAAPCAWWGDGLELSCAAWTLGVAHPTGYPLYVIIGHFWMRALHGLTGMDPGRALTLFSTTCLILAGGVVIRLLTSVARSVIDDLRQANAEANPLPPILRDAKLFNPSPWMGFTIGLVIGLSYTLWDHATFAEVYPLTYLLGALVVAWCWRMRDRPADVRHALVLGVLMGLMAIHHYSGSAMGPLAVAATIDWTLRARRRGQRGWPILLVAAGTFLTIFILGYATLILLARPNPPLNWGDPSNLRRLLWVMMGGQFGQLKLGFGGAWMMAGLGRWLAWWGTQWIAPEGPNESGSIAAQIVLGAICVGWAALGLLDLARRRRALGLGLLGALAMTALFGAIYHIPDIDGFFLVALPSAAVGWFMALRWLCVDCPGLAPCIRALSNQTNILNFDGAKFRHALVIGGGSVIGCVMIATPLHHLGYIYKHDDREPLARGERVLAALPKGAVVLTAGDNDIYALWHQQMVLGKRPDVTVFGANFIYSGWYRRYFERPDRPRVPVRVVDGSIALDKYTADVALANGVILPCLRSGHRVFATYDDPTLKAFFGPEPIGVTLATGYHDWFVARNDLDTLPSPVLYELHPAPAIANAKPSDVEWAFYDWYRVRQAAQLPVE